MRKFIAIIAAILLAFLVTGGMFLWKGKTLKKEDILGFFKKEQQESLPKLPNIKDMPEELNLSYEERLKKGDDFFQRGFLTFASNEYVKAANLEPDRAEPYSKLLKVHFELRNYKKALYNAELALKINPNDSETAFNIARIHLKLSEFDKAKTLLEALPKTTPPDARVLYYQGLIQGLYADHEGAQKSLKEAQINSKDPILLEKIKNILEAYSEFNVTQAAEPLYLSELLARSFNKVTEYEMAIHLLKDILKNRADLRDGWILLGFSYLNLEKHQFALTAFEKAYSLDSQWSTTQYFLGLTHKELGHAADAITFFNLALLNDFQPQVVVLKELADLYFETKDYEKSAENYGKVLEISKEDVHSFVRPVWLYLDFLNDPQKALKLAETAALTFPESAMSYNLLGWSYTKMNDEKKAETYLKKAIEIDPNMAAAHYNIGNLYLQKKDQDKALAAFQKAYELDANGSIGNLAAQAYNNLLKNNQ